MKNKIRQFALSMGLTQFGVSLPEAGKAALVFLFPYYAGDFPGVISAYARGADYHKVVRSYLEKICRFIENETGLDFSGNIFCDISPYSDREIAYMAGLGFYGKNHMLINPTLGSYFFIGYIITEGLKLTSDTPLETSCAGCGKCIAACPGGALTDNFYAEKCASNISQKKGELTQEEENILLKSGFIWGCDKCQSVCPHNSSLSLTPIPEFRDNLIYDLRQEDLEPLSERQFRKKYCNKAFTWRGKKPLLRNIILLNNSKHTGR